MVTEKKRHTFISYSRINKEFALKLARELKAAGFPIWLDQLDIPTGARWDDEIEKALRECGIFMVILTPASIASENAKDEIGYAIDHGKRILPVLLEDCEIPLRLRRFQYVDFTKMNYTEGVRSAKELLARLVEEKSVPVPARVSDGKERPTQPAKVSSAQSASRHRNAAPSETPSETVRSSQKRLSTKPVAIFTAIAIFVILGLIGGASFLRGMFPSTKQSSTSTSRQEIKLTNTSEPTTIADAPTPAPQPFYTEEFDGNIDTWMPFIKSGKESEFSQGIDNGKLVVHISPQKDEVWAYLINNEFKYTDVQVEVVTTNMGNNANGVSLVCRYSDKGWYEFRISNDQTYSIYAFGPGGEVPKEGIELFTGGSKKILAGNVKNVYTATCKGKELSLDINGTQVKTTNARYDFPEGNIGIGFSSPKKLTVDLEFESAKISQS
jgi:hypothetical protein